MSPPRSLVLITVDCLRADHVGFMGYPRQVTPFLDSLAADSLVFESAIAGGAPTYYSFPAIMASRHPLGMGRDVIGLSPDDEPTLATTLSQIGYATAAFVAGNPYITQRYGYTAGFDVFQDFLEDANHSDTVNIEKSNGSARNRINSLLRHASRKLGVGSLYDEIHFRYSQKLAERSPQSFEQLRRFPSAEVIVSHAGEWLQKQDSPFFLWLHLMDPHGPYYPPQEALDLMGYPEMTSTRARYLNSCWNRAGMPLERYAGICEEILALYDSGIRWMDQQVANLTKALQTLGLWENCVFALTADHGEEFLDHGGRMHAPPKVTEELVHVPLLLCAPSIVAKRIDSPFSLLNLAPTLLDCVHAPLPSELKGQSYWRKIKDGQDWNDDLIVECIAGCSNPSREKDRQGPRLLAVREARYKLILDFRDGSAQLFDLHNDAEELNPLPYDVGKPVRRRLLERAYKHIVDAQRTQATKPQTVLALRNLVLESLEA